MRNPEPPPSQPPPRERSAARRDVRRAVVLALVAFVVYNANLRTQATGDSLPARFLPFATLEEASLHLDTVLEATRGGHPNTYWILGSRDGRWASTYPVVTPLLVTPLYAPAVAYLHIAGRTEDRLARVGELMEKLAASTVAAVTVALLYLLLRRRLAPRDATLLAVAFAFGTNTWVTCSQALWQHGPAQLFLVVALLAMTRPPSWVTVGAAGAAAGLLVANRPPDAALAAGLAAGALVWLVRRWELLAAYAGAAALPVALTLAYNLWMFGILTGGYGVIGAAGQQFFARPLWEGLAGLLVSPGKGLLLWAPFFLFLPLFLRRALAGGDDRKLDLCLLGGVLLQLLVYAKTDWRAGFSYGPRFLSEALPLLVWVLAPVVPSLKRTGRILFVLAIVFSVWVQAVGAFRYQGGSDVVLHEAPGNVWRLDKTPYLLESRSPWARWTLLGIVFGLEESQTYPRYWWERLTRKNR